MTESSFGRKTLFCAKFMENVATVGLSSGLVGHEKPRLDRGMCRKGLPRRTRGETRNAALGGGEGLTGPSGVKHGWSSCGLCRFFTGTEPL